MDGLLEQLERQLWVLGSLYCAPLGVVRRRSCARLNGTHVHVLRTRQEEVDRRLVGSVRGHWQYRECECECECLWACLYLFTMFTGAGDYATRKKNNSSSLLLTDKCPVLCAAQTAARVRANAHEGES